MGLDILLGDVGLFPTAARTFPRSSHFGNLVTFVLASSIFFLSNTLASVPLP